MQLQQTPLMLAIYLVAWMYIFPFMVILKQKNVAIYLVACIMLG